MKNISITALQNEIDQLWSRTDLSPADLIVEKPRHDGSPHVEIVNGLFDIVITERGTEHKRISGLSLYEASRWFLHEMAFSRAHHADLMRRAVLKKTSPKNKNSQDIGYSRWNWMALTIEYMHRISKEHGKWSYNYYFDVLQRKPLKEYEIQNTRWPLM
ncbi:hypothetical protein ACJ3XI_00750 [Litorimonas sp. RW-G-Af-16]|uniref:hypothetical protein n=1 Tax=Litorimonas sp. RW-G-Af-16 TaxID=3241168 RepID=UPI00390C8527